MTAPTFSILIPTRNRPDTFPFALETAVEQTGDDYEIVVADNCSGPGVAEAVAKYRQRFANIKYIRSESVIPMGENWERGLSQCEGQYVTVLGDDDGLLPSALEIVRKAIQPTGAKIVSWRTHTYWWPDTIARWDANRLLVQFGKPEPQKLSSAKVLAAFYADNVPFQTLPMIYCAFIHRDIISRIRNRYGQFFFPADIPPDIGSGLLVLSMSDSYFRLAKTIAVRGNSKKSSGTAYHVRSAGSERRNEYLQEERRTLAQLCHPDLIPSPNLHILLANVKLRMRDECFPERTGLQVNLEKTVRRMVSELNEDPAAYDDNLADAKEMATKIGMRIDSAAIPPRAPSQRGPRHGLFRENGHPSGIWVDCTALRIRDVAGACRLAEALAV